MHTVVLTRPEGKNEALAMALQDKSHAQIIVLPALTIQPTITALSADYYPVAHDLLIFVSAQAAQFYLTALAASGQQFPIGQRIATVGAASAQPFYDAGLADTVVLIHPPVTHPYQDSEALWALLEPVLSTIKRVLLVRGQQGREWLSQQLVSVGKKITRCSIYERIPALWDGEAVIQLEQALAQPESVTMLLSSSESMQAIYDNVVRLGLMPQWQQIYFVAIHPRIAQNLQELLYLTCTDDKAQVRLCAPSQSAMVDALLLATRP